MNYTLPLLSVLWLFSAIGYGQNHSLTGSVISEEVPVSFASITLNHGDQYTQTDSIGNFEFTSLASGQYELTVHFPGYQTAHHSVVLPQEEALKIKLFPAAEALDEVVITGASRGTAIRKNPLPIQVIDGEALQLITESNVIDALTHTTPGLSVVKTGPNISKPFIRGLGYNRVLTLFDGIRQEGQQWGDEHGLELNPYNVSKVEVIKGPSSLSFGSDALAGVVSFYPYLPQENDGKLHGEWISEYHSNNGLIGNGLRLGYSDERYILGISGAYRLAKNYQNPIDGRVYLTGYREYDLSGVLGYKHRTGVTQLRFTLYDNHQGIPDGSRDSISRKFTKQIYEGDLDQLTSRPIVSEQELNSYSLPDLIQHIQHYRLYLKSEHEFDFGRVDLLLAGQQNIRREYNHPTQPDQPGLYVRLNTLNYGLSYQTPRHSDWQLSAGINGMWQINDNLDATDFPIPDYHLFDIGAYAYGKWAHNAWTISGGLRYDIRRESWDDFYVGIDAKTGFSREVSADTPGAELQFSKFSGHYKDYSAGLGVTYTLSKAMSLKANIGRAFRAPNITELASNGLDPGAHIIYLGNRNFGPETSFEQDFGVSLSTSNWSAEVAVFNNNIDNYIFLTAQLDEQGDILTDAQGNKTYAYQQTKAQLYGGETSVLWHPQSISGLEWETQFALVFGKNRAAAYRNAGVNGEYLPLIPPLNFRSHLRYALQLRSKWLNSFTPAIGVTYHAAQKRYFGLNQTETFTADYTLVQLGFSSKITYYKQQQLTFSLHIDNLFNRAYQSHLNRLKYFEDYANGRGIYNMGRNISFKLQVPF